MARRVAVLLLLLHPSSQFSAFTLKTNHTVTIKLILKLFLSSAKKKIIKNELDHGKMFLQGIWVQYKADTINQIIDWPIGKFHKNDYCYLFANNQLFDFCVLHYRIYPKDSDTLTVYHSCSKIWTGMIYYPILCLKVHGWVAYSVDPDETPHSVTSHPSYTVCEGMSVRIHTVKYNIW